MKRTLAIILGLGLPCGYVCVPVFSAVPFRGELRTPQSQPTEPQNNDPQAPQSGQQTNPNGTAQQDSPKADSSKSSPAPATTPQRPPQATPEQQPATPTTPAAELPAASRDQGTSAAPANDKEAQAPAMPAKKAKSRKKATSKKSAHRQSTSIPKVQAESPKPAQTDSQKDPCPISPTQPSNEAQPPKRVVREGGTAEPQDQLSPAIPDEQASHARQNTGQLLASTDENLKKAAGRNLDANQQAMLAQIRKFMEQANEAVAAGDVQRGHNLAMKAHMLSDDLVKH